MRMKTRRVGQQWIFDRLLGLGGLDVLHPESVPYWERLGYDHRDLVEVFSRIRTHDLVTKSWATQAQAVERRARRAESEERRLTASSLYRRAALLWGRARYSIFADTPLKRQFDEQVDRCYRRGIEFSSARIEKVVLSPEGGQVYGWLHLLPERSAAPCVILVPGMDMFKEDWHTVAQELALARGMHALAIDGPGQGETLAKGTRVHLGSFEKAGRAFVDFLASHPEVDPERIAILGVSMGSYWAARVAAEEPRLRACASGLSCQGPKDIIFNVAQPNFKLHYMHMSGIDDEADFDRMAGQMVLDDIVERIHVPMLLAHGELDELTPLEDTLRFYEALKVPGKELWVFEDEFHPLGGVASELYPAMLDWVRARLDGKPCATDRRAYFKRDGSCIEGAVRAPLLLDGL